MSKKRIGILTSGGDCPGLNAVIRGVVRSADKLGWEVVGFKDGFEGLLPEGGDYMMLDRRTTAGIMHLGGTIIGTTNRGHFVAKVRAGEKAAIPDEIIEKARKTFNHLGLSSFTSRVFRSSAFRRRSTTISRPRP
jgi:6-phosphofructokinase